MKKYIIYTLILFFGLSLHTRASGPSKIAVVDLNKVLRESTQLIALNKEQKLKGEEFHQWLSSAQADVEKQKTKEEKEKLIKKYDVELKKRHDTIQKHYTSRLQQIEKDISSVISKEAKNKGYDIIISKNAVLYGGDDITDSVAKLIK